MIPLSSCLNITQEAWNYYVPLGQCQNPWAIWEESFEFWIELWNWILFHDSSNQTKVKKNHNNKIIMPLHKCSRCCKLNKKKKSISNIPQTSLEVKMSWLLLMPHWGREGRRFSKERIIEMLCLILSSLLCSEYRGIWNRFWRPKKKIKN